MMILLRSRRSFEGQEMKNLAAIFFAGLICLFSPVINALSKTNVTIVNNTEFDFKIENIIKQTGKKVIPSYKTKVFKGSITDLDIGGMHCYLSAYPEWKCVRKGERKVLPGSVKTETEEKEILILAGQKKKIFSVDRDQPSIKYKKWWKDVEDKKEVPERLRKALSAVYPFERVNTTLISKEGGLINLEVISERIGNYKAFLASAAATTIAFGIGAAAGAAVGAAAGAILVPEKKKAIFIGGASGAAIGGLLAGTTTLAVAAPIGIVLDQKSGLTVLDKVSEDALVKVSFETKMKFGKVYKDLIIIIDPIEKKEKEEKKRD